MRLALLAALVLGAGATPALAQQHEAWQAPTLSITRYDEDWSDLSDPEKRAHHWTGPLKYIPLGDDAWLSTGIEVRARSENYRNNLWGSAQAPDDSYLWTRALPYADLHVGKVRAFVQPIIAYAIGVQPSAGPVDETGVDLLQGFGEVDLGPVTLRGGRQMLSFGTERLIGTRYGPNVPLAFDGVRADVHRGRAILSLIAFRPVRSGTVSFDDATSYMKALWGAYATMPGLDLYYLGYENRDAVYAGEHGREERHSLGIRSHGTASDWNWNVEGVVQFGRFADKRIFAWTMATEVGRSFPAAPMSPRLLLRVNAASGDGQAGDRKLGTFNALFPKGKYFGELSPVGPYNIINMNPVVTLTPARDITLGLAGMAYWRASRGDGVYDIPGNLLRAPGNATARFIGKEVEASLAWQATPELELSTSFSVFAPGGFIRETGPAHPITLLGFEANFRI
ncbi:alginate export family protein [Sphingobium sp.]|uniref:alginate export family protein n=1 Tax=Sphingobium sp. TaxID=1912891 RepID=UPI0039C9597A